jgi:hypothetical protein
LRTARYRFDFAGLAFGSTLDGKEFGSATWQVLIPFNIWTIGHVVQDCFCDDAAITTTATKPRVIIKGHFENDLRTYVLSYFLFIRRRMNKSLQDFGVEFALVCW